MLPATPPFALPARPQRFRLNVLSIILLVAVLLLAIAKAARRLMQTETDRPVVAVLGGAIGGIAVFVLVITGIAWLCYSIRRSNLAGNLAFSILCGLFVAGSALQLAVPDLPARRGAAHRQTVAELASAMRDINKEVMQSFNAEETTDLDVLDTTISAFVKGAANVRRPDARDILLESAAMYRKTRPALVAVIEADQRILQEFNYDLSRVREKQHLSEYAALLREADAARREHLSVTRAAVAEFPAGLRRKGIPQQQAAAIARELCDVRVIELTAETYDMAGRHFALWADLLTFLERKWGTWRWDSATNAAEFDSDSDQKEFDRLCEALDTSAKRLHANVDERVQAAQSMISSENPEQPPPQPADKSP